MARRRIPTGVPAVPPERLLSFVARDWVDPEDPLEPDLVAEYGEGFLRYQKARRRWSKARNAWCVANGIYLRDLPRPGAVA